MGDDSLAPPCVLRRPAPRWPAVLRHSFVHCPGIGPARERTLWESGYVDWDAFLVRHPAGAWRDRVAERLVPERAARELPRREAWRLVPECAGRTLYLDLETDGSSGAITCIGVSDGVTARAYVEGTDLETFPEALEETALLVTYNGTGFDLPILQRRFPDLDLRRYLHLDLRIPLHRLGLRGGLKAAEAACGIARAAALRGADGWTAVLLWRAHRAGHPRAQPPGRHPDQDPEPTHHQAGLPRRKPGHWPVRRRVEDGSRSG